MNKIRYEICVALQGPIAPQEYTVGDATVRVSYPEVLVTAFGSFDLPRNRSTLFSVEWSDAGGQTTRKLRELQSAERFQPLTLALGYINQLLLAFKFVRIGHADGVGLRTIGEADTLFYCSFLDGVQTNQFNMNLRTAGPGDPHGTTPLAVPHINSKQNATARRFVRSFELFEHGYFTETLVIAFAILDDSVQVAIRTLLGKHGVSSAGEQEALLRGIKERRLALFLGPLLTLLTGRSLADLWPDADDALRWLNKERNQAMHSGYQATRRTAALALFASMKVLVVLWRNGCADTPVPVEMFRHAKLVAAWEEQPLKWVPQGPAAETLDYD